MEDQLVKELIPIQVDRPAPHLTTENRDALLSAVADIYLLLQILMVADADIGRSGAEKNQRLMGST